MNISKLLEAMVMRKLIFLLLFPVAIYAQPFGQQEINRWTKQAKQVTIIRDNWGIPHIYGKTDADAVFGLLYAQCEDDFRRVEMNYIEKLGRMAEVKGEQELYNDLLIRMLIDSSDAIQEYKNAPVWLKNLMDAYAGGINYYLYKHPETKPALLTRFEPWYTLLWTDGSIGAIDVAGISTNELRSFYAPGSAVAMSQPDKEYDPLPGGSNGFAIAPSRTASGNAMLYINPHVTFYFRPEVAMQSDEGLHAYGAVTWGQFFIYQGFNEHLGWMHTSSYSDVADAYMEQVVKKDSGFYYEYDRQLKPVGKKEIELHYLSNGRLMSKKITTYFTHHGPVLAQRDGKWISVRANNRDIKGLIQSWQRTKATNLAEYTKTMELLANTSNNTVYADDQGNIAYWHGNFMPKRDPAIDWSKPVDGSTSHTEWNGLHAPDELIFLHNPASGWIQNCNSTPFTASGSSSPRKIDYPAYMAPAGENFRGVNAIRLLSNSGGYTIDKLIATGYDTHLPAFDVLVPALVKAYENSKADTVWRSLEEPVQMLSAWDKNSSRGSVATTLAVEWGQRLWPLIQRPAGEKDTTDQVERTYRFAGTAQPQILLKAMLNVIDDLHGRFGNWRMPWGEINRYQRLTGELTERYDDNRTSIPVGFAASTWGSLPSYVSRTYTGTKKRYGYNGNSFICAVEFGKKLKAKSLLAGGVSGDPRSSHFDDQASMYAEGRFKDVLFYREDVVKHAERTYHPGE